MRQPRVTGRMLVLRRVVFWILVFLVPLMAAEVALRLVGYARPRTAMSVQNATNRAGADALNRRFGTDAFEPDRYLLWRMRPGGNVGGIRVNELGLLGTPATTRKPEGAVRVLCMGDSVSAATYRVYPGIAGRLMEAAGTTATVEVLNASVAGYSTEQARRWWRRLRRLEPDIVVLCFGWNDHFPALNLPDKELGARNVFAAAAHTLFRWSRVYQLASAPADERWRRMDEEATAPLRVGPEQFGRNLAAMVDAVRASGAQPILATQPANLSEAGVAHLRDSGFGSATAPPDELHRDYNAIVRSVASATGATLLDLDEAFEFRDRSRLFEADGMHLTGPGHNLSARLLVGVLRHLDVLPQESFERIVRTARYDTTAPDKPLAAWTVANDRVEAGVSEAVAVSVIAKNAGNTVWLRHHRVEEFGTRRNVEYGNVSVTGRWRTEGADTTGTVAASRLSHDLLPGESTSNTLALTAPAEPGEYLLEVGLTASEVGDLKAFGAEVTTVTVVAFPKGGGGAD